MIFQFQLIFVPTGTLCLMLFAPTNLQTHGVAHQVCYNLFSTWDPFNIMRPIEQHVAVQETKKSCLSETKALKNEFIAI